MPQSGKNSQATSELDDHTRSDKDAASTLLLIGVHREELAFGDRVASGLAGQNIDLLRVPAGLSARRPRADQLAAYRDSHASLYEQMQNHWKDHYQIIVDLHCSLRQDIDIDIFCHSRQSLEQITDACLQSRQLADCTIRGVQMISDDDLDDLAPVLERNSPFMKPDLPPSIWKQKRPLYIGLEVYLDEEGPGAQKEWERTQTLISLIGQLGAMPEFGL